MRKVICIGDTMLDVYHQGSVNRISPEAPVPVLLKSHSFSMLGGAGNVLKNMNALDLEVIFFTRTDLSNSFGKKIRELLELETTELILLDVPDSVIVKERMITANHQLLRVDTEKVPIQKSIYQKLSKYCEFEGYVVLSDYAKGFLTDTVLEEIFSNFKKAKIVVDPKSPDLAKYNGAFLVKPNKMEFMASCKFFGLDSGTFKDKALKLKDILEIENLVITCGEEGSYLVNENGFILVPPLTIESIVDVSGAGDTWLSALVWWLNKGNSVIEAMSVANKAAASVISEFGSTVVNKKNIE